MSRLRHALVSLFLTTTAVAGGPGLTLTEAWEHTHRVTPGHGFGAHYESRGGQDHDDRCEIGLTSAPARAPLSASAELRLPPTGREPVVQQRVVSSAAIRYLLPLSRAPPAVL